MKWYSSLSKLLLEETSEQDERFAELRGLLANQILNLYKVILKYVIKSICAYNRNPALRLLRDLITLDDWNGSMDEFNKVEGDVKSAASDYGVRQTNSYLKLIFSMHISTAQNQMMRDLLVRDMTAEIESLQSRKDHLLLDSYKWILGNKDYQDFTEWHQGNTKRLLWVKGDPGKGKTMLLIGIIRELTAQLDTHFDEPHLSYYFCQGTDASLNTATAVLRGLMWMLLRQEKLLIRHLDKYNDSGSKLFEDRNAFYSLKVIFRDMLEDRVLKRAYLVIDALDECRHDEPGLPELLKLISEISETNDKVKWLVSSRNIPYIETRLEVNKARTRLSLELNADSVASAVEAFIDYKLSSLADRYKQAYAVSRDADTYKEIQKVQSDVAKELREKAAGTFLWVALVFKQIEGCGANAVLDRVRKLPSGLDDMYAQMMRHIKKLDDREQCKKVLLTLVNTYRPLHLSELVTLAGLHPLAVHQEIVKHCGLLTIREDNNIVYFVHQSAKDFLIKHATSEIILEIFPHGYAEGHRTIALRSLEAMSAKLRRDIYDLQDPGCSIEEVKPPDPDPLTPIRYACVYWIDHLCEIESGCDDIVGDNSTTDVFLKKHFLHWLEALSLTRSTSSAGAAIKKLGNLLAVSIQDSLSCLRYKAFELSLPSKTQTILWNLWP